MIYCTGPIVTFSHGWPLNADAWGGQMQRARCLLDARLGLDFEVRALGLYMPRYYKTSALKSTLERLIDFDRIKPREGNPTKRTEMDSVQLIYRPMEPLGAFKDFEFSRSTMAARWKQGLSDVLIALQASPWLAPMPKELGVRVFDVMHDILTSRSKPV